MEKEYWDKFYHSKCAPVVPSQFCVMVAQDIKPNSCIIEFGCGNGRDISYFSLLGHTVIGIDASEEAIQYCFAKKLPNSKFVNKTVSALNLNDMKFENGTNEIVVYSRFFQHTLDESEQTFMLNLLNKVSSDYNLRCYFEFRNDRDKDNKHIYENHYRRYQSEAEFLDALKINGFSAKYAISGNGMSYYKGEDPNLTRVIAVTK